MKNLPTLFRTLQFVLGMVAALPVAQAADKVTLATNWLAQPELGGFYQAVADGTYARHGLEVTIKPGGPLVNNRPLLAFGKIDFLIGTNLIQPFDAAKQQIPTKVVAAFFQKDPQCLLSHADGPWKTWDDLKQAPLLMGNAGRQTFFLWLHDAYGFPRANLRPYNHSLAPFLNDPRAAMQGFATAEPERIREASGKEPRVFLLADHGWNSYSTVLETRNDLIAKNPELVRRFVDASIVGWNTYLDAEDTDAADVLIKKDNPSMTDGLIKFSRRKMSELELLRGGEAKKLGIGAIDVERVKSFCAKMVAAGMYQEGEIDPTTAVTVEFVNKGVGVE
ncbi:ABC transporter substrate-binding protein [Lacipirellula limnantheis]|uniref:NMT1/THI5 like protein n=1 Tax=Lacipirellula limnantheis TaxID=2528024 RepID=A0A517TXH8_9BACT|nr:ABC transporter substrate-binding protein [Lacipirellula limnantheis]QDT73074.1 NMT1/THI5 like protein [Lacipirellula limnantheis]